MVGADTKVHEVSTPVSGQVTMSDNMIPILTPMGPSTTHYIVTDGQPIFMSTEYGSAVAVYQSRFGAMFRTHNITLQRYEVDSAGWVTVEILAEK